MNAGLRVPVADNAGELLWVHQAVAMAETPADLCCIGCGDELTWRNGEVNRPHFAHKTSGGCSGETALHKMAIDIIARSVQAAASEGYPYPIEVPCKRCMTMKLGNLARHADLIIDCDRVLADAVRPDLLIRSGDGKPRFVIEVIVSHAPDPAARALYEQMGLPLIKVWPEWDTLELLPVGFRSEHMVDSSKPASTGNSGLYDIAGYSCRSPRHFQRTDNPTCATCNDTARRVAIEVAQSHCYRCKVPTSTLDIVENAPLRLRRIAAGCPDLKGVADIAGRYGIQLREVYSATAGGSYLAHHCRNGHFQGDNFIHGTEGTLDRRRPVQHMTVCVNGHWADDGPPRPWPDDLTATRIEPTVGLVGEPAGVFGAPVPRRREVVRGAGGVGRLIAFGRSGGW